MIAIAIFVVAFLWSLALWKFRHRRSDVGPTKAEDERLEGGFGLEIDCVVCLGPVSGSEKLRLLACNHGFHVHCIEAWLKDRSTCPICRSTVSHLSRHQQQQQRRFYDGVVCCFLSPLQNLCKWMQGRTYLGRG
ncbi:RING-H2 finger protein [Actinidia chinensis var. chinensis]|uniref:RING-H2 finger protein n=1 Tax=Actinidia chinensis var. chinensis TaxID=1590841 RepID=A0A2R6R0I9_ACTCC|nr:RING-H2 finger protein [Actinidia chinensis var. chinensis]